MSDNPFDQVPLPPRKQVGNPFDQVPISSRQQSSNPFDQVPAQSQPLEYWQQNLKPVKLPNGYGSMMRSDGLVWVGPQTKSGISGWADPKSIRIKVDGSINPAGLVIGSARPEAESSPWADSAQNVANNLLFNPVTQGATDALAGVIQKGANLPGVPATIRDYVNAGVNSREQAYQGLPINQTGLATVTRMGGQSIPLMAGMGGPVGAAMTPEAGLGANMLGAAGQGGLLSMAQPITTNGTPEQQQQQVLGGTIGQGATGAAIGAAIPLAGKLLTKGGQALGLIKGEMPPGPPGPAALQAEADKRGVSLTAGDLDPTLRKFEDVMAQIPGSGMGRQQQQQQIQRAAQNLVEEYKAQITGNLPGTIGEQVQAAGRSNHAADVAVGHAIYDAGAKLAGDAEVQPNQVVAALSDALQLENQKSAPDSSFVQDIANRLRRLIQTKKAAAAAGETPMNRDYQGIRDLATEFWQEAQRYERGTKENALYTRLSNAARQDLSNFAAGTGNESLQAVTGQANNWWRTKVKDYSPDSVDYSAWAKQFHGKGLIPDAVMDFFIQPGVKSSDKARYLYRGLPESGREAVRAGILEDAYIKATGGKVSPGPSDFSAATMLTALRNNQAASEIFFPKGGKPNLELQGFMNLLEATSRSGGANSTIHTGWGALAGQAGVGELLGIGHAIARGSIPEALAAASPTLGARFIIKPLFTTPAGKKLLLEAAISTPGTRMMQNVIRKAGLLAAAEIARRNAANPAPENPTNPEPAQENK